MNMDSIAALPPFVPFVAGLLTAVVIFAVVAYPPIRRLFRSATDAETAHRQTQRMLELLAASPDAVFAWPKGGDGGDLGARTFQNRELNRLLGVPAGETVSYEQLLAHIGEADRPLLENAVQTLSTKGTAFDILVAIGAKQMHVAGRRAFVSGATDDVAGDTLWLRDVTPFVQAVIDAQSGGGQGGEAEEDRLRLILDAMPIPVWLRTPDLDIAFANVAAGEDGTRVPAEARTLAQSARRGNQAHTAPIAMDFGGGRRRAEVIEAPLGAGAGTIGFATLLTSGVSGAGTDELENALSRERAGFEQFIEQLTSAVAVYGADRRLQTWNEAFAGLWQLEDDWLAQHPTLAQVLERLRDTRRLPEVANFGDWRTAQMSYFESLEEPVRTMMHLPDSRSLRVVIAPAPGGGLFHVYEDISDQLNIQREYKSLDAVQRRTIDNLQEAVAVFGSDGRLKLGNTRFGALWDMDAQVRDTEPHLNQVVDGMRAPGEDEDGWADRRARILGHINARRPHKERLRRADGTVLDWATVPLPDGALLVSFLDVTDEAKVEDALRARAEALEEAGRMTAKFIADISYEVRTPMNTVTGFADALAQGYFGELNPRQAEYVQGILSTSQGLITVLADILELASVEAGTAKLEKDSIDLHALLTSCMRLIAERARAKEIHLGFDVPANIGWIAADERRLKQVVLNLLSNAVRFTPSRGGVRLAAARDGDDVLIAVADTGVGIPQADLERVFRGFERGKPQGDVMAGEIQGAGLGLAMVKSFIELHGGSVEIKSSPNRGTTVTCRLPATGTEGGDARDAFQS